MKTVWRVLLFLGALLLLMAGLAFGVVRLQAGSPDFPALQTAMMVWLVAFVVLYWLFFGRRQYARYKEERERMRAAHKAYMQPLDKKKVKQAGDPLLALSAPYGQAEYAEAVRFINMPLRTLRGTPVYYPLLAVMAAVVVMIPVWAGIRFLWLSIVIVGLWAMGYYSTWRTGKKQVEPGEMQCDLHNTFMVWRTVTESQSGEDAMAYADVNEIYETGTMYYFFMKNRNRHFLPAAGLSPEQRNEVAAFLSERFPGRYHRQLKKSGRGGR